MEKKSIKLGIISNITAPSVTSHVFPYHVLAICNEVADKTHVEGVQCKGGLWRIYLTNADTRAQLLCTGFKLRVFKLPLNVKILFLHNLEKEDKVETTRVYVRNNPLSFDNVEQDNLFKGENMKWSVLSTMQEPKKVGKLTNSEPLPERIQIGI